MNFLHSILANRQLPFLLLTLSVMVWLICFPLFQDGMFMDGVQYAAISRNLARGVGSFWFPVFSENSVAGLDTFHEHPPLVFFLQSIFFKILGLHNIYPERIYCLVMLLLTTFFIIKIWRKIFEADTVLRRLYWLPVLLWLIVPVVFWSYANNIQENTMGLFTTTAVYFFFRAVDAKNIFRSMFFYAGIISVAFAFLSKGVPGLFPLIFFAIHFLVYKKKSIFEITWATVMAFAVLFFFALAVMLIPDAKQSISIWFFDRMLHRIEHNPVSGSHFKILFDLFTEQLPSIIFCAIFLLLFYFFKIQIRFNRKHFLFFILLGCAGSLPLMLTLVQRAFYFTPALPFFAIALAVLITDGLNQLIEKYILYRTTWLLVLLFSVAVLFTGLFFTVSHAGEPKRSPEMLHDVYEIGNQIPENTTVCVPVELMWNNWAFRCYMLRYNSISFAVSDTCKFSIDYKSTNNELFLFQITFAE